MLEKLEAQLASGQDSSLLRFSLANGYFRQQDYARAIEHARCAVEHDVGYSAAWRLLGQAQTAAGEHEAAEASFRRGIEVAENKGDRQVAKEMQVFLKRLQKAGDAAGEES